MLILTMQIVIFAHLVWLAFFVSSRLNWWMGAALLLLTFHMSYGVADGNSSDWWISSSYILGPLIVVVGSNILALMTIEAENSNSQPTLQQSKVVQAVVLVLGVVSLLILFVLPPGGEPLAARVPWPVVAGSGFLFGSLGLAIAYRTSMESGEAFFPELVRSYDYSFLIAAVFGGQVILAMWTGPGTTETMLWLLMGTITAAIAIQVYLDHVQALLDRVAFARVPWLRHERAELRKIENLLPRVNMTDPLTIDEDEFSRLTRRALSNYGDLTKLATSPLTNLPEVHRRLAARNLEPSTLERARELKIVLAEAIEHLKPRPGEEYGTTDEWRFYNALYYPYIIGMRPYSTTAVHSFDDPNHWEILEWFRTYVPERTLYNWQNSAAALIAAHLREQEEIAVAPDDRKIAALTTAD